MRRTFTYVLGLLFASLTSSVFAQSLDGTKTYTIVNNNDATKFMQDNGTGGIAIGAKNDNSYWKFVATANTDCYYIQNAKTGKYIQGYDATEQEVATGDAGVEYYVKADASGDHAGKFRMSCTANSPYDFSSGTLGLNWKNTNTVQSFASVAGGNPRSAWTVTVEAMPEPQPTPSLSSPYTGSTLAEGDFFLYNVETGLWIQNNDKNTGDWNTRGATGDYGFAFGVSPVDNGWRLDPKFGNNHSMNASNFYLDTPDPLTIWSIVPVEVAGVSNAYAIKAGDNTLSLDNDKNLAWNTGKGDVWQLVTRDQRIAYMIANASAENPIDATFLIMDPRFATANERASAWTWNQNGGNRDDVRWYRNRRSYAIWNSNSFSISQTINDIPNGYYKLNVKGYYRDGDKDQCVERRTNKTEQHLGKYFLNNDKADMMSILDGTNPTWVDGLFFYPAANADAPYGHYPDNADGFNRIFQDYPNNYMNEGLVSTVTTQSAKIGIEKLQKNEKDWLAWDEFYLTYLGPIDVTEYVAALQTAINTAEALDVTHTSDALKAALKQALDNAKAKLNSDDTDELSAVTAALNNTIEAIKVVNVDLLREIIAVAEEGVDLTAANNAIANAKTKAEVDNAVFDLRTARKLNAMRIADVFTGSTPQDGVEYFFYNIGTGLFLSNGSDWNTHTAVDVYALPVTLVADGDNFKLKNHAFYRDEQWINFNAYVDTNDQDRWYFQAVDGKENVYNIVVFDRHDLALGYNPYGHTDRGMDYHYCFNVAKEQTDMANPNNQWKLVSRDELNALVDKASNENPVDVSYLIANPGLSRVWDIEKWTKTCDGGNNGAHVNIGDDGDVNRNSDYGYEVWNANSFSFTQDLTGLKPGRYEVSVNGFFRQGDGNYQAGVVNNDGELISEAYLAANDEKAFLPNIASEAGKLPGIFSMNSKNGTFANWPAEALHAFETGLYKASVKVIVKNDGKLTIGVKQDQKTTDNSWVLFDSFRLTYLGPVAIESMNILGDFTGGWDFADSQKMTQSTENPAIWTLAIEDFEVTSEKTTLEYKASANGQWGIYELPASGNQDWVFGTDMYPVGVYDLLFTVNTKENTLTLVPTFDETATGIKDVKSTSTKVYYNLNGQKVQKATKGLYIQEGKKVVIK